MSAHHHLMFLLIWLGGGILYFLFPSPVLKVVVLYVWLVFWLSLSFYYAVSAFSFSRKKGVPFFRSLLYGIEAFFHYPKFQWVRKPHLSLSDEEKNQILKESSRVTKATLPSSFLCPFCKVEIPGTLKTIPNEGITVKSRPLYCPKCHTRLDTCRYCLFFEPATSAFLGGGVDISTGKCTVIKKNQPIEELCEPSTAKRLREMGWNTLYAGIKIPDSFTPPDSCRQFQFDNHKTSLDHLPDMGRVRYSLLKLEETYSQDSSPSSSSLKKLTESAKSKPRAELSSSLINSRRDTN